MKTIHIVAMLSVGLLMAAGSANAQSNSGGGGEPPNGPHLMANSCQSLARLLDCSAAEVWAEIFRSSTGKARAKAQGDTVGQVNAGSGSRASSLYRPERESSCDLKGGC